MTDKVEAEVADLNSFPDLVDAGLNDLCVRYRELLDQESILKKEKAELMSLIKPLAEVSGAKSIAGDTFVLSYSSGGASSKISPEKLLSRGVSFEVIEACTDITVKNGYWQVRGKS